MIPDIDVSSIRAARSEVEFWSAFEQAWEHAVGYPHGMLVLGTPPVRMAVFRNKGVRRHLVALDEIGHEIYVERHLGPIALGDIRRAVRRGQWVISLRDVTLQWHVLDDARDRGVVFCDPMAPDRDLGLAPLVGESV